MKNYFIYFYSFAIISIFGFGQIRIPGFPFNIGQISYILLLINCVAIDKRALGDIYLGLYAVFILFYFLSSVITGFEQIFFTILKRKLFTLIPLYWGTKILISRFKTVTPLLVPLIILGILDTNVTISQVYGLHFFDGLLDLLNVYNEEQAEMMERRDLTIGISMNGIYRSAVHNGHNLLLFFCMSLSLLKERINIIRLLPTLIIFVGLFYCQQRSAFLFAVMALIIFFFILMEKKMIKTHQLVFLFILILFSIYADTSIMSDVFSESRLSEIKLSDRSHLFEDAITYVSQHLLIGGIHHFTFIYGLPPHNTIISAFMAGGVIGGFILIHMMFLQFIYIYKNVHRLKSNLFYVFAITFIALIGDSMFHNTGYVQGDEATFIIWALILKFYKFERNENNICK